jgi:16S rRNA (guanine966-N2)-methyltransferase
METLEKTSLRIIGGEYRSRKIQFAVDPRTRPMKDRTREAVMNLLGGTLPESIAFDLFGGTGILAFESISRGATRAVVFEILKMAAKEIQGNAKSLGMDSKLVVLQTDVLKWSEALSNNLQFLRLPDLPWIVFCCPPYSLWDTEAQGMRDILNRWVDTAPAGSMFAVELEFETSIDFLPTSLEWDIRTYKPAKMAIAEKPV